MKIVETEIPTPPSSLEDWGLKRKQQNVVTDSRGSNVLNDQRASMKAEVQGIFLKRNDDLWKFAD